LLSRMLYLFGLTKLCLIIGIRITLGN
jgi:hypothetical protein